MPSVARVVDAVRRLLASGRGPPSCRSSAAPFTGASRATCSPVLEIEPGTERTRPSTPGGLEPLSPGRRADSASSPVIAGLDGGAALDRADSRSRRSCRADAGGADRRGHVGLLGVTRGGSDAAERPARVHRGRAHRTSSARSSTRARRRRRPAGRELDLQPFLSMMGMPPPEPRCARPPRRAFSGGNLGCAALIAATTLLLPISVDGALFRRRRPRAAGRRQMRGRDRVPGGARRLTLALRVDPVLAGPSPGPPDTWIAFGFDEDLDEAATRLPSTATSR